MFDHIVNNIDTCTWRKINSIFNITINTGDKQNNYPGKKREEEEEEEEK